MPNPILQQISGQNDMMTIFNAIKSGDVEGLYKNMLNTNPRFRDFVLENKNLTADQIARKYGVDSSLLKQCMR